MTSRGIRGAITLASNTKEEVKNATIELLEEIQMPKELVMNDPEKLIAHLKSKGRLSDL